MKLLQKGKMKKNKLNARRLYQKVHYLAAIGLRGVPAIKKRNPYTGLPMHIQNHSLYYQNQQTEAY